MNRLVKVALFGFMGTLVFLGSSSASAEDSKDGRSSNFNELGVTLLEGREEIKTSVMIHEGLMSFSKCNDASATVNDRLIRHIRSEFLYYNFRIGCESNGLFGVRFTFELMIEPKTIEDQAYATSWISRHNGIEIGGKNAWFRLAQSVDSKVTLMSGMVPAAGRGPLRVTHQKEAIHSFVNYGESQVFVAKVAADIRRAEIDGVFDAVSRVFGTDGLGDYSDVLTRVNYVRATALPVFRYQNNSSRNAWYYLFYDHDCRRSPNGMCL